MRFALTDLYQAKWTKDIHCEWMRNLLKNRSGLTEERIEMTRVKMDLHVKDCLGFDYEELIDNLKLPDPDDRHVLVAALKANAQTIVTYNLSDFLPSAIAKYGIDAQHPDESLRHLIDLSPSKIMKAVQETRLSLKKPPKSYEEYLAILEKQSLPQTVAYLKDYEWLI